MKKNFRNIAFNFLLYICKQKLRKECNLLEMSVG